MVTDFEKINPLTANEIIQKARRHERNISAFHGYMSAVSPIGCCIICGSVNMSYDTAYCIPCHSLCDVLKEEMPKTGLLPQVDAVHIQAETEYARVKAREDEEFKSEICPTCGATISHWNYMRANYYYSDMYAAIWGKQRKAVEEILKKWDTDAGDIIVKLVCSIYC